MIAKYEAEIIENKRLSESIYKTRFRCIHPGSMQFMAGQYVNIKVAEKARRSYSISTAPGEVSELETVVDVSPDGPGSRFFSSLTVGDKFEFMGPLGRFNFATDSKVPVMFLATGTGVVPFISMLRDLALQNASQRLHLAWGLRYDTALYFEHELKSLTEQLPGFTYEIFISRPSPDWQGRQGYITQELIDATIAKSIGIGYDQIEYYLCGSTTMIDEAVGLLGDHGVSDDSIHTEKFY